MTKVAKLALNDKKYLVEIHTLKNMPTSHLNADDTGELKTSIFGGSTRARVRSDISNHLWMKSTKLVRKCSCNSRQASVVRLQSRG